MAIIASPAFCDFVSCTTPGDYYPDVSAALLEVVRSAGGTDEREGSVQLGTRGIFRHSKKYGVGVYSLSGDALAELRKHRTAFDWLGEWLTIIGEVPHRVTRLDAAVDVAAEGSTVVQNFYRRARRGLVRLTQKAVRPQEVSRYFGASIVTGHETGTVYVGVRGKRDVIARVYDKRQELLRQVAREHALTPELIALNDPGPLTRYELELGRKVGVTLRDVYEPASVFWHYARESLLPQLAPADVGSWEPHALGFSVPRSESLPSQQLRLLLDNSLDVKRAVTLADRCGPHGRDLLCRWLQAMESAITPAVPNTLRP